MNLKNYYKFTAKELDNETSYTYFGGEQFYVNNYYINELVLILIEITLKKQKLSSETLQINQLHQNVIIY
mgnify:CR=1 FL=1